MKKLLLALLSLVLLTGQPAFAKWEGLPQSIYDYPVFDSPSGKKWIVSSLIIHEAEKAGLSDAEINEYETFLLNQDPNIYTAEMWGGNSLRIPYDPLQNPDPFCQSGIDPNYPMPGHYICVPYLFYLKLGFLEPGFARNDYLDHNIEYARPTPEHYGDYRLFRDEYRIYVGAVGEGMDYQRSNAITYTKEWVAYLNVQHILGTATLTENPELANVEIWIVPPQWQKINQFAMERFGISIPDENHLPPGSFAFKTMWISSDPNHRPGQEHVIAFGFYHEGTGKSVGMVFGEPWADGYYADVMANALLSGLTEEAGKRFWISSTAIHFSAAAKFAGCNAWDKQCIEEKAWPLFDLRAAYVGDACPTYIDYGQMPGFDPPILHATVALPNFASPMTSPDETALWYDVEAVIEIDLHNIVGTSFYYRVVSAKPVEPKACVPAFFIDSQRNVNYGDGMLYFPALHYGSLENWAEWLGLEGNHADRGSHEVVKFVEGQILF